MTSSDIKRRYSNLYRMIEAEGVRIDRIELVQFVRDSIVFLPHRLLDAANLYYIEGDKAPHYMVTQQINSAFITLAKRTYGTDN